MLKFQKIIKNVRYKTYLHTEQKFNNEFIKSQKQIIDKLNLEVKNNYNLSIEIGGNENND
jgi:CRISPR/Cas system CMR-associated protein Cmr3 (group 5 of RAMP superfamily)